METEEIIALIKSKLKTTQDLADEIGITRSTLSQVLNRRIEPGRLVKRLIENWALKNGLE